MEFANISRVIPAIVLRLDGLGHKARIFFSAQLYVNDLCGPKITIAKLKLYCIFDE